jgi:hypothetical protein
MQMFYHLFFEVFLVNSEKGTRQLHVSFSVPESMQDETNPQLVLYFKFGYVALCSTYASESFIRSAAFPEPIKDTDFISSAVWLPLWTY